MWGGGLNGFTGSQSFKIQIVIPLLLVQSVFLIAITLCHIHVVYSSLVLVYITLHTCIHIKQTYKIHQTILYRIIRDYIQSKFRIEFYHNRRLPAYGNDIRSRGPSVVCFIFSMSSMVFLPFIVFQYIIEMSRDMTKPTK